VLVIPDPITEGHMLTKKLIGVSAAVVALGASTGVALAGGNGTSASAGTSRLDDGKDLLPQAKITEQAAIEAAQGAESGALNEVDLEHYKGNLVWNVDVGRHDVKVDAADGSVLASDTDD
jgi:uncharacterized membrane protein YkoI